jgi:5-hydroxyisourate hydrolase
VVDGPERTKPASPAEPTISTHVLDAERGMPAEGVHVTLYKLVDGGQPIRMTQALTDGDGRIRDLLERPLTAGDYRLEFNLANERVSDSADRRFFRRLALELRVEDTKRSYHVPLLLSSFAMTTYRGS